MKDRICERCDKTNPISNKYCSQCGYELPKIELINNETKREKNPERNTRKNKGKILPVIVGIIAFGFSFFGVKMLFNNFYSFDKAMMKAASEINKSCPIMVDSDTRLDNAVAMPENVFQYNYTLINLDKSEINVEEIREYIEPNVVNNIKTNTDMKDYKENKVTMAYNYRDKNGVFILKINVTPEMYE
ncbi:hypothetical protein V2550_04745 [Tenacibaculum maritimum]|uniref:hypothetical protein n=1 Tax=Tenacibaculum maritimum TaxID=107401 RepID=UPI003876FEA9